MTILNKIKAESLQLRKDKSSLASYSSFIIGLCQAVGKSDGNRVSTDDEVQAVINKQIKINKDSLRISTDGDWISQLRSELSFLDKFKPDLVNDDELMKFINSNCLGMHIGQAMGLIKKKYGMAVDMGIAAEFFKQTADG